MLRQDCENFIKKSFELNCRAGEARAAGGDRCALFLLGVVCMVCAVAGLVPSVDVSVADGSRSQSASPCAREEWRERRTGYARGAPPEEEEVAAMRGCRTPRSNDGSRGCPVSVSVCVKMERCAARRGSCLMFQDCSSSSSATRSRRASARARRRGPGLGGGAGVASLYMI